MRDVLKYYLALSLFLLKNLSFEQQKLIGTINIIYTSTSEDDGQGVKEEMGWRTT